MTNKCFDLHPCHHYGKKNHSSERYCKRNQPPRVKINYAWIDPWKWSSTIKQLSMCYQRIQSHMKTNSTVKWRWWNSPTLDGGEFRNQVQIIVSPFRWKREEMIMELKVVVKLKVSTTLEKAASGKSSSNQPVGILISQWASTKHRVGIINKFASGWSTIFVIINIK